MMKTYLNNVVSATIPREDTMSSKITLQHQARTLL